MAIPINKVTPCNKSGTATGAAVTTLPPTSSYQWGVDDIGEQMVTESNKTVKNRKGQTRSVSIEWTGVTLANGASILTAFDSEYVLVELLDAKTGALAEKQYIVSGRNAPLMLGLGTHWESISFTLTQQDGVI